MPWEPVVFLPVNLTVRFDGDVLHADDPRPWCQQKAKDLLGPEAGHKQISKLADCLTEYASQFKGELPLIAAAVYFYPNFTRIPPRAMTTVKGFGEHSVKGPLTMAMMRESFEQPDELSFGEAEITETEVPTGSALRVHRYRKAEPAKRRSRIGEEVVWVIWPPGSTAIVSMATRWMETAFSKAAITIADDMAKNFRIEPKAEAEHG
jgi:hypothetical protein